MQQKSKTSSIENFKNHSLFGCQVCQESSENANLCNFCFMICCEVCRNTHSCGKAKPKSQKASRQFNIEKKMPKNSRIEVSCLSNSQRPITQIQKKTKIENCSETFCQRCENKPATTQCLQCKNKYFCTACFRDIHSLTKLSKHQQLDLYKLRYAEPCLDSSFIKLTAKLSNTSQFNENNFIQMHRSDQDYDLLAIQTNINITKKALKLKQSILFSQTSEIIKSVSQHFERLKDQINLKAQLALNSIKSHQKQFLDFQKIATTALNKEQINLNNLKLIEATKISYKIPTSFIQCKRLSCKQATNQLAVKLQTNSFQISFEDFIKQAKILQQTISKIPIKKIQIGLPLLKQSVITNSSPQNNSKSQRNSRKQQKMRKSLINNRQNKSLSKFNTNAISLLSPNKLFRNSMKLGSGNQKLVIQSLFHDNREENKLLQRGKFHDIKNTLEFNAQSKLTPKRDQQANSRQKNIENQLISPTMKRTKQNYENKPYSIVGDYGKYIQKRKKRSKQMKYDIIQFTKRFVTQTTQNSDQKRH